MIGPNPPARVSLSREVLPNTAEPVPAITTRLGISPVAASERIRSLVMTIEALGKQGDRKSTRLNSSHTVISYAVFCLKKKKRRKETKRWRRSMERSIYDG